MTIYAYMVLPLETVAAALSPEDPEQPDAFLSADVTTKALRDVLSKGYRWIRTDGNFAVFEIELKNLPRRHE